MVKKTKSIEAKLFTYECTQCGYRWHPRTEWPKKCPNPKCQSFDWASSERQSKEVSA